MATKWRNLFRSAKCKVQSAKWQLVGETFLKYKVQSAKCKVQSAKWRKIDETFFDRHPPGALASSPCISVTHFQRLRRHMRPFDQNNKKTKTEKSPCIVLLHLCDPSGITYFPNPCWDLLAHVVDNFMTLSLSSYCCPYVFKCCIKNSAVT